MHWDIMKVKHMFKQKMFFRQPTGCMPWQHTAEVLCGKWVDLGVAVGFAVSASKCSQISSAQNDHSHGANAYHFQSAGPNFPPHDGSVCFASPLRATSRQLSIVFYDQHYSRELLTKPRRLTTWYFTVHVGVRRHAEASRCLLRRQSRVGRFSIIHQVHDHPTKNPAEALA